jgi:hypothetical protein
VPDYPPTSSPASWRAAIEKTIPYPHPSSLYFFFPFIASLWHDSRWSCPIGEDMMCKYCLSSVAESFIFFLGDFCTASGDVLIFVVVLCLKYVVVLWTIPKELDESIDKGIPLRTLRISLVIRFSGYRQSTCYERIRALSTFILTKYLISI